MIIELGGNDALRGLNLNQSHYNFEQMIQRSLAKKATVLIIGIRIFPNYGPTYVTAFKQLFANLSKQPNTSLISNWLMDIATNPTLMQADGIHPNDKAQPLMLQRVWPTLKTLLKQHCAPS